MILPSGRRCVLNAVPVHGTENFKDGLPKKLGMYRKGMSRMDASTFTDLLEDGRRPKAMVKQNGDGNERTGPCQNAREMWLDARSTGPIFGNRQNEYLEDGSEKRASGKSCRSRRSDPRCYQPVIPKVGGWTRTKTARHGPAPASQIPRNGNRFKTKMSQYINPAKSIEWSTPQWLYDALHEEFNFKLDACATADIAKCEKYFSQQEDALLQRWENPTFCNPPYGISLKRWIGKAHSEAVRGNLVVMLLPARTDVDWFHRYCYAPGVEIRFIKGRVNFGGRSGRSRAPFPSMIVIFRPPALTKGIDKKATPVIR